jgi:hypothetical protein
MRIFWGLAILIIGLYLLARSFGWLASFDPIQLIQFWPVLLILFGITLIAKPWQWGWLVVLLAFILAGGVIFLLISPNSKFSSLIHQNNDQKFNLKEDLNPNIKQIEFILDTGAVNLNIGQDRNELISLDMDSNAFEPKIEKSITNGIAQIKVSTIKQSNLRVGNKNDLSIKLTDRIPISFKVNSGASKMNLDLSGLKISGFEINTGASDLTLKLGQTEPKINGLINAGASNINIVLPNSLATTIVTKTGLSSKNFNGFNQVNDQTYQSLNHNIAVNQADIEIKAGVSSLNISY